MVILNQIGQIRAYAVFEKKMAFGLMLQNVCRQQVTWYSSTSSSQCDHNVAKLLGFVEDR